MGHVLEALVAAGGGTDSVPAVAGIDRDQLLEAAAELIARGWVTAGAVNHGDNKLLSVRNLRITSAGVAALDDLRRQHRGEPMERAPSASLEEKKAQRLTYMNALYDATDGSTSAAVDMWELGQGLGWDRPTIDRTVEYLDAEDLLTFVAMGGAISITHRGVVEVEQSRSHPEAPTEHFPATVNVLNVQTMYGSQIQQGSPGGSQTMEIVQGVQVNELLGLIQEIRDRALPLLDVDGDEYDEITAELDVAERQLQSKKPRREAVTDALARVGVVLTSLASAGGSATELIDLANKLHQALPLI
jgi:hypothetical protein